MSSSRLRHSLLVSFVREGPRGSLLLWRGQEKWATQGLNSGISPYIHRRRSKQSFRVMARECLEKCLLPLGNREDSLVQVGGCPRTRDIVKTLLPAPQKTTWSFSYGFRGKSRNSDSVPGNWDPESHSKISVQRLDNHQMRMFLCVQCKSASSNPLEHAPNSTKLPQSTSKRAKTEQEEVKTGTMQNVENKCLTYIALHGQAPSLGAPET